MKPMRAIIFKELRENAIWLVLLGLAVMIALAFGANASIHCGMSIAGNEFQTATIVSFSIAGAIVGLLQILQDQKNSRAAFIEHRPISLTKAFAAKVIAGLVIYFIAVGVPLLMLILYVRDGGKVNQPFDWRMTLPSVNDVIGGVLCYFTGIFIAARPARWIGSRMMPLGSIFLVLAAAFALSIGFGYSLMFIGGGILLVLPATMGAFISRGRFERSAWIVRTLQVICVGVGVGVALGVGLGVMSGILRTLLYPHLHNNRGTYSEYKLDLNGQPVVVTSGPGGHRVTDLEGNLLSGKVVAGIAMNEIGLSQAFLTTQAPWSKNQSFDDRLQYSRFRDPATLLQFLLDDGKGTSWYYVVDRRTIEGMDNKTGALRGSVGPHGFVALGHPLQPFVEPIEVFAESAQGWIGIITPTQFQEINLIAHTAKLRFSTSPSDPILSMSWFSDAYLHANVDPVPSPYAAVLTQSKIHVLNSTNDVLQLPVEHGPDQSRTMNISQVPSGGFVVEYLGHSYSGRWLVTTDAAGHVIDRRTLPPLNQAQPEPRPGEWLESLELPVVPPILTVIRLSSQHFAVWLNVSSLLVIALAVLSALLNFWVTRCYRFGRRAEINWSLFGLAFGITAVLTLLSMRNFPPRIRCGKCGKRRLVNHEKCEHCGNSFDPPSAEGIDIFAGDVVNPSFAAA